MATLNTTQLPNIFIDKYLPSANPTYCSIYIYSFRHSFNNRISISIKDTADTFKVLESDIINAWEYWKSKQLVNINFDESRNINIEFLSLDTLDAKPVEPTKTKKPILLDTKPVYSPKELEMYKTNYDEISKLFSFAESSMGKLLSSNDLSVIFSFYDWLRLPIEVIEILLNYCRSKNHRSIRYIEKVALDWAENDITTVDAALQYINTFNKDFREILKALGQSNRNPTPKEIEYMKKWLYEYNMPLNIILEACDKTIIKLGKPQYSYTDKILEVWHKSNVKTIEDIKHLESSFYKVKEFNNNSKGNPKTAYDTTNKKSKFVNYEQRTRDYDELERLEREHLKNYLKGD